MKRAIGPMNHAEKLRAALIHDIGCVACRLNGHYREPCEIHHLNIGGRHGAPNRGHKFTVGLCAWHHRGVIPHGQDLATVQFQRGPSFAREPDAFRERICRQLGGTDCDALMLDFQNYLINQTRAA